MILRVKLYTHCPADGDTRKSVHNMAAWRVCRWRGFVLRRSPFITKCSRDKLVLRHYAVITGNAGIDKSLDAITNGKAENWLRNYENFVGLTEVREAQTKVIQVSKEEWRHWGSLYNMWECTRVRHFVSEPMKTDYLKRTFCHTI